MPTHRVNCRACGAEHSAAARGAPDASRGEETCPYRGSAYPELRAGHDQLYFGRWRGMDAPRLDVRRARRGVEELLRAIAGVLETEDVPAARRDLNNAFEALYSMEPDEENARDLLFLDHALSYAHRAIGDLLHEKGLPPHDPADFAGWYDAGEVPFREEW